MSANGQLVTSIHEVSSEWAVERGLAKADEVKGPEIHGTYIIVWSPDGDLLTVNAVEGCRRGNGVAMDREGNIYIGEGVVLPAGRLEWSLVEGEVDRQTGRETKPCMREHKATQYHAFASLNGKTCLAMTRILPAKDCNLDSPWEGFSVSLAPDGRFTPRRKVYTAAGESSVHARTEGEVVLEKVTGGMQKHNPEQRSSKDIPAPLRKGAGGGHQHRQDGNREGEGAQRPQSRR